MHPAAVAVCSSEGKVKVQRLGEVGEAVFGKMPPLPRPPQSPTGGGGRS